MIPAHSRSPVRPTFTLRIMLGLMAAIVAVPCFAYPFGSGTCNAVADGSFMESRTHHPQDNGGFGLRFSTSDYIPGETLGVTLAHAGSEQFIGFLIYAENASEVRGGLFDPIPGTTFSGILPPECAIVGHTITHDDRILRSSLSLAWTAPAAPAQDLTFRALVFRADPMAQRGTDFYEVRVPLPVSTTGIFRSRFESIP